VKLSAPEQAKRINLIESHLPKKRKVYFSPKMVSNIQLKGSLNFFDLPPLLPTHAKTRSFSNFSGGSWLRNIPHSQEWASEIWSEILDKDVVGNLRKSALRTPKGVPVVPCLRHDTQVSTTGNKARPNNGQALANGAPRIALFMDSQAGCGVCV
jgi:hypothetical protein